MFNAGNVSGTVAVPSTFINYGRLDVQNDAITVASNVTFSESGTIGASDSIGTLTVNGTLRHEQRHDSNTAPLSEGLALTVTGNATIAAGGSINVNTAGLRGANQGGLASGSGETYAADLTTIVAGAGQRVGGSHGGLGGSASTGTYGSSSAPVLLGSGGGGLNTGGAGGGRVDLVVNGTLNMLGPITANGGNGGGCCAGHAGGSGGSVRVRVNIWDGTAAITPTAAAASRAAAADASPSSTCSAITPARSRPAKATPAARAP